MYSRNRTALFVIAGVGALLLGAFAAQFSNRQPPAIENATIYKQPRPIQPFSLRDQDDRPFTLDTLKGRWVWLFFGFTHCPDVCPTTLSTLAQARSLFRESHDAPLTLFVSVDPERDGGKVMGDYAHYFDPDAIAVTGDEQQLQQFAKGLYASFARIPVDSDSYTMDHSATIYFIDPNAAVVAVSTPPHTARGLADDFLAVQAQWQ